MDFPDLDISALPDGARQTDWLTVADRPDGGAWRLPFLYATGEAEGPTVLVIAGVHGDEYEGIEAIPQILRQVAPDVLSGRLLMVPVCNVPAFEAATRSSPVDGLNLARVFPGDPEGSITRRIAYWLTRKLIEPADYMIDLHSGGVTYDIPTLVGYTHADDERAQASLAMARAFGAPILWGHPPPLPPGRSISAAAESGVPAIYTEARGGGYTRPDDVACYRDGVLNVMRHLSMLPGEPPAQTSAHHFVGEGNLDQVVSAPSAGLYRPCVELLDMVVEGQPLCVIENLFGKPMAEIRADRPGVVIMLRRIRKVEVGDGLVHLTNPLA